MIKIIDVNELIEMLRQYTEVEHGSPHQHPNPGAERIIPKEGVEIIVSNTVFGFEDKAMRYIHWEPYNRHLTIWCEDYYSVPGTALEATTIVIKTGEEEVTISLAP